MGEGIPPPGDLRTQGSSLCLLRLLHRAIGKAPLISWTVLKRRVECRVKGKKKSGNVRRPSDIV